MRRCLRERLTSWRMWNRIRLRVSGASARRSPWNSEAPCTTVSRSTMSAKTGAATVGTGAGSGSGSPRWVMTYSWGSSSDLRWSSGAAPDDHWGSLDGDRAASRCSRPAMRLLSRSVRTASATTSSASTPVTIKSTPAMENDPTRLYLPRMIRRTRSQRSLIAASAPSVVGR